MDREQYLLKRIGELTMHYEGVIANMQLVQDRLQDGLVGKQKELDDVQEQLHNHNVEKADKSA